MKNFRLLQKRTNEGFTLIELLVVILIIAILAAVGIVALISALNSGKKSAATTVMRNGITAVRAWQANAGQTDYAGLTYTGMNTAEPDITWVSSTTEATAGANEISIIRSGASGNVWMAAKSEKGVCYYAVLISNPPAGTKTTYYQSATGLACTAAVAIAGTAGTYQATTKAGWDE